MKKTALFLATLFAAALFFQIPIHAAPEQIAKKEIVKQKISGLTAELGLSESAVDNYLAAYADVHAFIRDLIDYKMYQKYNPEVVTSFEWFRISKPPLAPSAQPRVYANAARTELIGLVPEKTLTDNRSYSALNSSEKLNYATGQLLYEDVDLHLPGVNGLDLNLISRFNPAESALCSFGAVPGDAHPSPDGTTIEWNTRPYNGYRSIGVQKYNIGAGWGFAFSNVQWDYLHLADGSVVQAVYNSNTKTYTLKGRYTEDLKFEDVTGDNTTNSLYRARNVITYKDGKKEFFNNNGDIIRTEDRYGNQIKYFYSDDGLMTNIVDSAGRNITFERPDTTTLNINIDGVLHCSYHMGRYKSWEVLESKYCEPKNVSFYYQEQAGEISLPYTSNSELNEFLTLSEVMHYNDGYSTQYTYELGTKLLDSDTATTGRMEYARLTSRKEVSVLYNSGTIANERRFTYNSEYIGFANYVMTEEIVQTGAKTEYTSDYGERVKHKKRIDPNGGLTVETTYTYNQWKQPETITQRMTDGVSERVLSETYVTDAKGNITSHTDVLGNTTTYQYDPLYSIVTQMAEPIYYNGQQSTRYTLNTLDSKGNILSAKICVGDPNTVVQSTVCTYDTYGNTTSRKMQPEYMATEYFSYTPNHAYVAEYKKNDTVIATYTYDNLGRKIAETDGLGRTTHYQYNTQNQVVELTNPDSTNQKYLYSSDLGYIYQTNVVINEKAPVQAVYYDNFGRITGTSELAIPEDELQYDSQYHFDDLEWDDIRFIEVVHQLPWTIQQYYEYDSIGRVISSTVGNNRMTKYTYDTFDRVTKITNPDTSIVQIQYDDLARTRTTIDEEGHKTVEEFDDAGRQIAQTLYPTDTAPITQTTEYDCSGQVISTTDYNGNTTTFEYDALGRKTAVTNALGERSTVAYAADLSYMRTYYPDNTIQQSSYFDNQGRLQSAADAHINTEYYTYDAVGNLTAFTDKSGHSISYQYDNRNRLTQQTGEGYQLQNTYDPTGKVTAQTVTAGANSNTIQYQYSVNGLTLAESTQKFQSVEQATFCMSYDETNTFTGFVFGENRIPNIFDDDEERRASYQRNFRNQVSTIYQPVVPMGLNRAQYTYHNNGLLASEELPSFHKNHYSYDGANRLTQIVRTTYEGDFVMQYDYTYDANGNQTQIIQTAQDGTQITTQYEYDALNRLKKEVNGHNGNMTEYTFDCRNNVTARTVSGMENYTEQFTYTPTPADNDQTAQQIEVTKYIDGTVTKRTCYYVEPNGNTTSKTITDGNGNPCESTVYSYNANHMLTKAVIQTHETNKRVETEFFYDAQNRRQAKTVKVYEGTVLMDSTTTEYFWCQDKVQYERTTSSGGDPQDVGNLWGARGLLVRDTLHYTNDGHGNIDAILDGENVREYHYDAYGNEIVPYEDDANPYRYCSENFDEETGLYYLRNRYYDPELGRFLTEDPAKDGDNWFVYCGNNPTRFKDPSGLNKFDEAASLTVKFGANIALRVFELSNHARDTAVRYAEQNDLAQTWDNEADALRHFYWNVMMTRELGYNVAKLAADNHEFDTLIDDGWHYSNGDYKMNQATLMDLWNNETGRNMAINPQYANERDVFLFADAKKLGLVILNAADTYEFLGVTQYIQTEDWTVRVAWDFSTSVATFKKEGLPDLSIRIGA